MIQLAVNLSMIFTEVPLIERFALARKHGFDHVEIQFPYELSIEQIREQLERYRLNLCLINLPVGDLMQGGVGLAGIPGREREFYQALQLCLRYASMLHVPNVNILAGKQPLDADLLPCLKTFASNLKLATHALSDYHIQPLIEMINGTDMPRFLIQNIAQAQDILEAVRHPALKLQFDCYHMAMMGEDILESLQENMTQIGHIQFADFPNRHEPNTGDLNYNRIFEWLKHSNYTGFTSAEYRPSGHSEYSFAWKQQFFDHIE
ncbi:hydroxypyruvate isomerase family protein [Acinetobacter sp. MD2]|uniref:hydroxypyruvate isomerase family protein n=1 Tax=Acinetobacter sp. MD2 TaxID=2600066 RepID=UPI002D1F6BBF|nr:TIM barrel protein [Acinetobacter sp. MD2]MEB3767435.1 TIM barrel protein [Acinetobacter sp. MD2]